MWTLSKFFILCLSFCFAFACTSEDSADPDAGSTDTDTGTGTDSDTGTGTEEEDTWGGADDCETMETIAEAAVTDYCVDYLTSCCYCLCYNKGQEYTYEDAVCTCEDDTDPEPVCEDAYLELAQTCVADTTTCYNTFYNMAETGCLMTPLE